MAITISTKLCTLLLHIAVGFQFLTLTSQETIKIVAVVDVVNNKFEYNLKTAVDYINLATPPKLHKMEVEIIHSRDNDSFGAMDQVCSKIPNGANVIIDMSSRYVTATIRSLAEAMGITHVSAVDPNYESKTTNYNVSVNLHPPSSTMLQSIRDIVSSENLTNVGIIYDHTFDLDNKPKRLLRNIPSQHLYLKMATTDAEIDEQLDKIKVAELEHLFLAGKDANVERYLGRANARSMMTFKFSWYALTLNSKIACTRCLKESSVVISTGKTEFEPMETFVEFMNRKFELLGGNFNREDVEMDAAFHYDIINMVYDAAEKMIANSNWKTINYTDCYSFVDTNPIAFKQAVDFRNEITKIERVGVFGRIVWQDNAGVQNITLEIKRVKYQGGSSISEEIIGKWSQQNKIEAVHGSITNKNVKKTYRILTIEEPPFVFKSDDMPANNRKYFYDSSNQVYFFGYCIDLIYHLQDAMNFEFTLIEPEDGVYGTMQEGGSWNGMVKDLMEDKADIVVAPLSVMAERENVIDFTVPYYDLVGITILMKKPKFEYAVFKFMSVLEGAVWGCVFSAFIIVSILLAIFDKYSPYSYQNNKESWDGQGEEPRVFTLKEGLWFCMTSLTPQGGGEAPRALSGRLVAATWWMFGFIMIATYTANLAAFLTVSRLDQPIESLDDLAKQFKTKYAPQASTATETYFKRMADIEERFYTIWKTMSLNDSLDQEDRAKLAVWDYPVSDKFTNMWASMKESKFPVSFSVAIDRIKNPPEGEEFAYIGDATQNRYAVLTDCDLWEVGEEFSRKPYALAVQEGSPLKTELSGIILQLLNQRILEDMKTYWWSHNETQCPKIEDESDGISIQNIGGVFLVVFIGIGLGLITLGFEYYWYKWRPSQELQQTKPSSPSHTVVKHAHDNGAFEANGST